MPRNALSLVVVCLQFFFPAFWSTDSVAQTVNSTQQTVCDRYHEEERCRQLVEEFYTDHKLLLPNPSLPLDFPPSDTQAFVDKIAPKAILETISTDLKAKADQAAQSALQTISTTAAVNQVGGAPAVSGTTSLVAKPTTTDFLSIAAESGAFTDTLNGDAFTIQANGLGLTKYVVNQPVFRRWNSALADRIQPLNFTISLNVAKSGSSTLATTGTATNTTPTSITSVILPSNNASFQSFGANYALYRPYNPQDKKFWGNWEKALSENQALLTSAGSDIARTVNNLLTQDAINSIIANLSEAQVAWHQAGAEAERSDNFERFVAAYVTYENKFADYIMSRPDAPKTIIGLSQALDAFNAATYRVLNQARGTPLATFDYLYTSPIDKPATHEFTIVVSDLFRGGKKVHDANGHDTNQRDDSRTFLSGAQLTTNFTGSVYASLPVGAKYGRFRDFQLSAEFDKPFGGTLLEPRGIISVAGYGQYQYDPTVLKITGTNIAPGTNIVLPENAEVLLGTAGWIGVFQGKIVFNLSKGLSLPIALKWSNKTDLLKGSDIKGQFGLTYDLSALSKLISNKD